MEEVLVASNDRTSQLEEQAMLLLILQSLDGAIKLFTCFFESYWLWVARNVVYEAFVIPCDRKVRVRSCLWLSHSSAKHEVELLVQLDQVSMYAVFYHGMEEDSGFIHLGLKQCTGNLTVNVSERKASAPPTVYFEVPSPCVRWKLLFVFTFPMYCKIRVWNQIDTLRISTAWSNHETLSRLGIHLRTCLI